VIFTPTALSGMFVIDAEVFPDERGHFTRAWLPEPFAERGLETRIAQASLASNRRAGTIRGLHYQTAPFEEVKIVRAVKGAVYDVTVDLRPDSPTYLRWVGVELSERNHRLLYVPKGCAHGYQTLADGTDVFYFVSAPYSPAHQRGLRWDDPAIGIAWPLGAPTCLSDRDRQFPDFAPAPVRP
jgi:dTDP-4-dehydrorhamnose 3,5-epimerase